MKSVYSKELSIKGSGNTLCISMCRASVWAVKPGWRTGTHYARVTQLFHLFMFFLHIDFSDQILTNCDHKEHRGTQLVVQILLEKNSTDMELIILADIWSPQWALQKYQVQRFFYHVGIVFSNSLTIFLCILP